MTSKFIILYHKFGRFSSKPLPALLLSLIVGYSCLKNDAVSNLLYCMIVFFVIGFLYLLWSTTRKLRKSPQSSGQNTLSVLPFVQAVVMEAAAGKTAQVVASITARQVAATAALTLGGTVIYDGVDGLNQSKAAEIEAEEHEIDAENAEKAGQPLNAAYSRALANNVRIENQERAAGGKITQAAYSSVSKWLSNDLEAERSHYRRDRLETLRSQAAMETKAGNEKFKSEIMMLEQARRHSFERNEIQFQREEGDRFKDDYVERRMEESRSEWEATGRVERAAAQLNNISQQMDQSEIGRATRDVLVSQISQTARNLIVRRVELHFSSIPELPKKEMFMGDKHFPDQKATTQQHQTETESDQIGVFYPEKDNPEGIAERTRLQHALPLTPKFLEALDTYHNTLDKQLQESKDLIEELRKK